MRTSSRDHFEVRLVLPDAVEYREDGRVLRFPAELAADGVLIYASEDSRRWQPPEADEALPLAQQRQIHIRVTSELARSGVIPRWVSPSDSNLKEMWAEHWADVYREALRALAVNKGQAT